MGVWTGAAKIARRLGEPERAPRLKYKAQRLREEFDTHFFDEELGTYVLALDGNKKPCRIRTSNAGHALFAGIAYPERAASVVSALMDRSSLSGWGVRTVASSQASMIQSCLGMSFSPRKFNILFDEPVLPAFLDTLALRRLAVGGGICGLDAQALGGKRHDRGSQSSGPGADLEYQSGRWTPACQKVNACPDRDQC